MGTNPQPPISAVSERLSGLRAPLITVYERTCGDRDSYPQAADGFVRQAVSNPQLLNDIMQQNPRVTTAFTGYLDGGRRCHRSSPVGQAIRSAGLISRSQLPIMRFFGWTDFMNLYARWVEKLASYDFEQITRKNGGHSESAANAIRSVAGISETMARSFWDAVQSVSIVTERDIFFDQSILVDRLRPHILALRYSLDPANAVDTSSILRFFASFQDAYKTFVSLFPWLAQGYSNERLREIGVEISIPANPPEVPLENQYVARRVINQFIFEAASIGRTDAPVRLEFGWDGEAGQMTVASPHLNMFSEDFWEKMQTMLIPWRQTLTTTPEGNWMVSVPLEAAANPSQVNGGTNGSAENPSPNSTPPPAGEGQIGMAEGNGEIRFASASQTGGARQTSSPQALPTQFLRNFELSIWTPTTAAAPRVGLARTVVLAR